MITILNFGDSPFALLFFLVLGIALLVIIANIFAYTLSMLIDARANYLRKKSEK